MESRRDPTTRFSERVEYYLRARPGYPSEIVDLLRAECGLTSHSVVADVGCGTGLLSRLWLSAGCRVIGVEPNADMRKAVEEIFANQPRFTSVPGRAEQTGLPDESVNFVTVGQAFHWFETQPTLQEFRRILKPGGWAVIVWNSRGPQSNAFTSAYGELVKTFSNKDRVDHRGITRNRAENFLRDFQFRLLKNSQTLDYAGLRDRLLSSSNMPLAGEQNFEPMLAELHRLFWEFQVDGTVTFDYDTEVYYSRLK